ncbi:hypothetical protein D3C81_1006770 [compost metagenome]
MIKSVDVYDPSTPFTTIFFAKAVIVQNKNKMVRPLHTADPTFIQKAIRVTSPPARFENIF